MPGEQAIFVNNGEIIQIFNSGRYNLTTQNYPFISRLTNAFSGGISTFHSVVYFFRIADSKEILWGTDSPIQVRDKIYNIRTEVRVRGSYKVKVEDPALFLLKLLGNNIYYKTQEELNNHFINQIRVNIKSQVSRYLEKLDRELIGLESHLDLMSKAIQPNIDIILSGYGLKCINFSLSGIDIDTSKYDKIDEAQIGQIAKLKNAEGDKTVLAMLGDEWSKQKSYEVLRDMANNSGGASLGVGLGMGIGVANTYTNLANEMLGEKNISQEDPVETLMKLKRMLEAELITKEEYDLKKAEILRRM